MGAPTASQRLWLVGVPLCLFVLFVSSGPSEPAFVRQSGGRIPLSSLLSTGLEALEAARTDIRTVKAGGALAQNLRVKGKTDEGVDEPVTVADTRSNRVIVNMFKNTWPEVALLSEETAPQPGPWKPTGKYAPRDAAWDRDVIADDILVIVDPLDATKEFSEDLLQYVTTLVCVTERGRPVLGIVDRPFTDDPPIWGVVYGDGVHGMNVRHPVGDRKDVVTLSRSHTGHAVDIVAERLPGKTSEPAGGSGFKSLHMLSGEAGAYIHTTKIKAWDVCAGDALVHAAGGHFTDLSGQTLRYSSDAPVFTNGLVATLSGADHKWYLDHLKPEGDRAGE